MMPLLQLFLYSYALSFDVKHLPTAVLDFDHTTQSRQYVDALQQSNYFTVNKTLTLVRPRSTRRSSPTPTGSSWSSAPASATTLAAGRAGNVQVLVDGSDANSAQLGQAYAGALSRVFGAKVVIAQMRGEGLRRARALRGSRANTRIWYNPEGQLRGVLRAGTHRGARHDGHGAADREHARAREGERHVRAARRLADASASS